MASGKNLAKCLTLPSGIPPPLKFFRGLLVGGLGIEPRKSGKGSWHKEAS